MVIENDSLMKQIMKWNSSENLLTIVEDEKETEESTEILFYINSVTIPAHYFYHDLHLP